MTDPSARPPTDIAALREAATGATPGPWEARIGFGIDCVIVGAGSNWPKGDDEAHATAYRPVDAEFIAAAVNALPALLDEVERLGADNEALGFVRESCATAMTDRDVARVQLDAARTNLAVVEALHLPLQANENVRRNCITDGMQWPCATYKAATKPGGTA